MRYITYFKLKEFYQEGLYENSKNANAYANMMKPIIGNIGNVLYVIIAVVGSILYITKAKNININGRKVAKRECLVVSTDQNKYYMLAFVTDKNATQFDYDANGLIKGKKISLDNLVIVNKDEVEPSKYNIEFKEYATTLLKLNNHSLSSGNCPFKFRVIKASIQGQLMDNTEKMLSKDLSV